MTRHDQAPCQGDVEATDDRRAHPLSLRWSRTLPTNWAFLASIVALGIVALVVLWPVFRSPFTADDVPNSQRTAFLEADGQSAWQYSLDANRAWVENEGRFFPVSIIENTYLFDIVHDRATYKILQVAGVLTVLTLSGVLASILARNRWVGVGVVALTLPTIQFRHWFDPILGFGVLLPSVTCKVLVCWIAIAVALRSRRRLTTIAALVVASSAWVAGLLQYEVVYLLTPLVLLLVWSEPSVGRRRRVAAATAVVLPTILIGLYVASLRGDATPSPAYTVRLDGARMAPALIHQLLGPVPFNVALFEGAGAPGIVSSLSRSAGWGTLGWILTAAVIVLAIRNGRPIDRRGTVALLGLGLGLFILPALPISVSAGRQDDLTWGLAYLPGFIQGVGFGLATATLPPLAHGLLHLVRRDAAMPAMLRKTSWCAAFVMAGLSGMAVGVASAGNSWAVDKFMPLRTWQETFDASLKAGWLDAIPANAVVTSADADGWSWINAPYIRWRGGPDSLVLVRSVPEGSGPCNGRPQWCDGSGHPLFHLRTLALSRGDIAMILAPVVGATTDPLDPLIEVDNATIFGPSARIPTCRRLGSATSVHTGWLVSRCDGEVIPASGAVAWFAE